MSELDEALIEARRPSVSPRSRVVQTVSVIAVRYLPNSVMTEWR